MNKLKRIPCCNVRTHDNLSFCQSYGSLNSYAKKNIFKHISFNLNVYPTFFTLFAYHISKQTHVKCCMQIIINDTKLYAFLWKTLIISSYLVKKKLPCVYIYLSKKE